MSEEFWIAFIIWGGIILGGSVIGIGLTLVGLAVKKKLKKGTIIKELYNEKERKNGQSKGGSHGHY